MVGRGTAAVKGLDWARIVSVGVDTLFPGLVRVTASSGPSGIPHFISLIPLRKTKTLEIGGANVARL